MKKSLSVLTLVAAVLLSGCAGYYYEGGAYEVYPRHHRNYYNPRPQHYRGNYYSSGSTTVYTNTPSVRVVGGSGGYQSH